MNQIRLLKQRLCADDVWFGEAGECKGRAQSQQLLLSLRKVGSIFTLIYQLYDESLFLERKSEFCLFAGRFQLFRKPTFLFHEAVCRRKRQFFCLNSAKIV